jgi:3-dehydro-L-gulonate 2-dehydrogenase
MKRIPFAQVHETLASVLRGLGFTTPRADLCARLFAETTCDGVYTHGITRFPRFISMVRNGAVDPNAEPVTVAHLGALERWNGRGGPGNLNAWAAMDRAISLSGEHGIGCVALGNTNHWMRGGTYGWQAADAGVIGICWTNTMPNLPPWGASQPCIGNNPLVIGVPREWGSLVLDMAMSQFSYGALESYRKRGELLPVDGGFDTEGKLSRNAGAIEASQRLLPAGYWKGSGLAVVLDAMAALLSLGKATHQIEPDSMRETALSQVFVAINPHCLGSDGGDVTDGIVESLHRCVPEGLARYPGERTVQIREENRRLGLPVEEEVWASISAMRGDSDTENTSSIG